MTYKNCKILIEADRYVYEVFFELLDLFLLLNRITQEQYMELTGMLEVPIVPEEIITE